MTRTNNNIAAVDDGQVVVFKRPKINSYGHYSSEEFEDIFYKDVVIDGKHMFVRVRAPKNK